MEDTNYRERPRLEYMRRIMMGLMYNSYEETQRKVSNREEWRIAVNKS